MLGPRALTRCALYSLVAALLCFACLSARLLCLDLRRFASIAWSALLRLFALLALLPRVHQNFIKEFPYKLVGHHWKKSPLLEGVFEPAFNFLNYTGFFVKI